MELDDARRLKSALRDAIRLADSGPTEHYLRNTYVLPQDFDWLERTRPTTVGFGIGRTGGEYHAAVRFWDATDASQAQMSSLTRFGEDVDVRLIGPLHAFAGLSDDVVSGASIRGTGGRGAVGPIVIAQTAPAFLTNAHVVGWTASAIGTAVLRGDNDSQVGVVTDVKPLAPAGNLVDAALITPAPGVRIDEKSPRASRSAAVLDVDLSVVKHGPTSGTTHGVVSAFELDGVLVGYSDIERVFDNQVEIEGNDGVFSGPGDSGCAVMTARGEIAVIAMLFAGPVWEDGTASYANPIDAVLDAFDLK